MAMKIFVTGTNTDVGKTHVTRLLMEEAAKRGLRPAALKPIETGVKGESPADGALLLETMRRLNPETEDVTMETVVPCRFALAAAPYVAKEEAPIDWQAIAEAEKRLEARCDILFIEGAGGLMVPIEEGSFMIDLPSRLKAHTLLVSPSRLGSINDTLLSIEALKARDIPFDLAINLYEEAESFERVTRPFYTKAGIGHALLPMEIGPLLDRLMRSSSSPSP